MEAGKPDGGEGANPGGEAENGEAKAKPEAKEMAPDVGRIAAFRAGLASPEPKKARVDPTGAVRAAGDPGRRTKITGTSPVWSILDVGFSKYHEKSLDEYVVCNTCVASGQFAHAEFKYGKAKSTTNVKNHLETYHRLAYDALLLKRDALAAATPASAQLPDAAEKKGGLRQFFQPAIPDCIPALMRLIVSKHVPIDIVEDNDFRDFSRSLNSKAPILSARGMKDHLRLAMLKKRAGLINFTKQRCLGRKAAVTHDSWTSKRKQTYSSLSWHFLDEDFTLFSCPFDIKKIDGHTYASAIADTIDNMAAEELIEPTVACTDCEGSMVAAWRDFLFGGQGCTDHRLEKVSQPFFDCAGHKATMAKARKLAGHFHHSTQAMAKLMELGKLLLAPAHRDGLTTVQDVVTRWWSTFSMCERLIILRPVLTALEGIEGGIFVPEDVRLTATEWTIIEMGKVVLAPLMFAQQVLEGELYVTNSLVVPILHELRTGLQAELARQRAMVTADPNAVNIVACLMTMNTAFVQRFGNGTNVVPVGTPYGNADEGLRRQPKGITLWQAFATCLDVRTKDLYGIPPVEHPALWDMLSGMAVDQALANNVAGVPPPAPPPVPPLAAAVGAIGGPLGFNRGAGVVAPVAAPVDMRLHYTNSVRIELINFQAVAVVNDIKFDTLSWWKSNRYSYPLLAAVARLVLAVPATSAPSERMWSEAGLVVRAHRASMDEDTVAMLVFLRAVYHFEERYNIIL